MVTILDIVQYYIYRSHGTTRILILRRVRATFFHREAAP